MAKGGAKRLIQQGTSAFFFLLVFDVKLKAVGTEDPRRVSRSDEKGQNQRSPSSEELVDRFAACWLK